jgi:hypothetical protein
VEKKMPLRGGKENKEGLHFLFPHFLFPPFVPFVFNLRFFPPTAPYNQTSRHSASLRAKFPVGHALFESSIRPNASPKRANANCIREDGSRIREDARAIREDARAIREDETFQLEDESAIRQGQTSKQCPPAARQGDPATVHRRARRPRASYLFAANFFSLTCLICSAIFARS